MIASVETVVEIGAGLRDISKAIIPPLNRAQDDIEKLLARSTQQGIDDADGNRTGTLRRSYGVGNIQAALITGDVRTRVLESGTGYSDIYERGRRDVPAYYGRYVAQKAIDGAASAIETTLSEAADKVKAKIES